jgi:phosphatidylserine decarboxylase
MIHKEGIPTIVLTVLFISFLNLLISFLGGNAMIAWAGYVVSATLLYIVLQFFRNPARKIPYNDRHVLSPCDGKVVVIEEVTEDEYFHDRRIQVSIFMSPFNVHVNRYPISGTVAYYQYHPGKYLVAWHPKSSTENERTTVVISSPALPLPLSPVHKETEKRRNGEGEILFRQIAGALARRIVFYGKEKETVNQGDQCGFIKFGSRVDLFFPPGTKLRVKLNDVVRGGESVIAEI